MFMLRESMNRYKRKRHRGLSFPKYENVQEPSQQRCHRTPKKYNVSSCYARLSDLLIVKIFI